MLFSLSVLTVSQLSQETDCHNFWVSSSPSIPSVSMDTISMETTNNHKHPFSGVSNYSSSLPLYYQQICDRWIIDATRIMDNGNMYKSILLSQEAVCSLGVITHPGSRQSWNHIHYHCFILLHFLVVRKTKEDCQRQ
jgi:hypothetical protein